MRIRLAAFLCFLIAGGIGCALKPLEAPPEPEYSAPSGETGPIATVRGSQQKASVGDDYIGYVLAVDGNGVTMGRAGWNRDLPVKAGNRTLTVAFQRGLYTARAELPLDAMAGHQYEVSFEAHTHVFNAGTDCDFWIVDLATGRPVTDKIGGAIEEHKMLNAPIPLK